MLGLRIAELDGDGVAKAVEYRKRVPALSLPDCFALALAAQGSWTLTDRRCEAVQPCRGLRRGLPRPALAARRNALGRRCHSANAPRRPCDRQQTPAMPTAQGGSARATEPVCDARSIARVYMSVSPTRFATRSTTERSSTCWRVRPQGNRATTTRVQRRSIDSSARAQYPCLVSVSPAIAHSGGLSFATSAAGWSAYWLSHLVRGAW